MVKQQEDQNTELTGTFFFKSLKEAIRVVHHGFGFTGASTAEKDEARVLSFLKRGND